MQTTISKENTVLQWCMKELNDEMVLSAELEYHIAKQDAKDVFEASDGIGTDEEVRMVVGCNVAACQLRRRFNADNKTPLPLRLASLFAEDGRRHHRTQARVDCHH